MNSILSKYHETYQSINNLLDEPEEIIEESFDDEEFKKVANA